MPPYYWPDTLLLFLSQVAAAQLSTFLQQGLVQGKVTGEKSSQP